MSKISNTKCKTFQSHLRHYQKKSHLQYHELAHILYLTPLHNYYDTDFNLKQEQEQEQDPLTPTPTPKKIHIEANLNTVSDVLSLLDTYKPEPNTEYSVNLDMLHTIRPELEELNAMIGMKTLKTAILDQLLFYIQGFDGTRGFKHTVLYGSPGTGKTEIAKIMGKMYSKLGVIKKPQAVSTKHVQAGEAFAALMSGKTATASNIGTTAFKKITRTDLVAGYVGQTAMKTNNIINECLGGVIFLDEAYSLGGKDDGDTFSKECVDTLCEALSNHKEHLMFIIAGYEKELKTKFFSMNPGLESRFVWRFKIDDYTAADLWEIFISMVKKDSQWKLDTGLESCGNDWFKRNFSKFPNFGRDIETFLFKTQIAHSRRVYSLAPDMKGVLTLADMEAGLAKFFTKNTDADEKQRLYCSLYS